MNTVNGVNTNQIYLNKIATPKREVAFKGNLDLDALRDKQDEFRRMSEKTGDNGIMSKVSKLASQAIGVAIAFTATKICLGKAADMISGTLGKGTDKLIEKVSEKSTQNASKITSMIDKVKNLNLDKIAINVIAAGAALGVALKDFGLVKKPVSEQTADLVDNAIDKANSNGYNNFEDSPTSDDFSNSDFDDV